MHPQAPRLRSGLTFPAAIFCLLGILGGCRLLQRPNPQLPPELTPPEGPTAATVVFPDEDEETLESAVDEPGATDASPPAVDIPLLPRTGGVSMVLPPAPRPPEGKVGRLQIEALSEAPGARNLTPLPNTAEFRKALRQWDQGPLRYIILKEEQDIFKTLKTDEDRLQFIRNFWARRDRDTETIENEYRLEFWRRVATADRRFIDTPEPGWKTDRGRIWILLGPPDQKERFPFRAGGRDVERWIYRDRPNYFVNSNFYVAFRRIQNGAWELSNDPRDFDPVFRDLKTHIKPFQFLADASLGLDSVGEEIRLPLINPLNLFLDLGQVMAPPELYRVEQGRARVQSAEVFGAMDIRSSFEFMGQQKGGAISSGIVLGILKGSLVSESDEKESDANLTIDMSIYPDGDETSEKVVRLSSEFGPSRENYVAPASDRLFFRASVALKPATYLAVYRLFDQTSGQSAQARETFTVPDRFSAGLTLSTIVLARRMVPLNTATERPDAFTLGRFRIVPNLEATYHNGETFAFYYQVNGATFDPRTGRRRLDTEYGFAVRRGEEWVELGEGLVYRDQENPQGWSVPLAHWPPASYRLTVKIKDLVSGLETSQAAYFRVGPGS